MPKIEAAAYYFPNYHVGDPRNALWHGQSWTEWDLVKQARPRFPRHAQPKIPLWGYEDEADPAVMARKIAAAADHGLTSFIFDWYWYEDGPYLERALESGFLRAGNRDRLKFALMWANHDWTNIHPGGRAQGPATLAPGLVSPAAFRRATDHMIERYFSQPSYWRVAGGLYLSIYQPALLMEGLGGPAASRAQLDAFRERVRAAGLGDLHLNAVVWHEQILPSEGKMDDVNALMAQLGFDSISSYIWVHHRRLNEFPFVDFPRYAQENSSDWEIFSRKYHLPYFPNVTMGWDPSPRTVQSDVYENLGYPFTPILQGNTPAEFGRVLQRMKEFIKDRPAASRVFTINAWNEWTEGSYLEPDTVNGYGYLESLRNILVDPAMPVAVTQAEGDIR